MSKTIEITRTEDIRPGDRVTLAWNGDDDTTVSGIVRTAVTVPAHVRLEVGGTPFWLGDGPEDWHVVAATRKVPDAPLPTKEGSVIVASGDDHGHKFADVPLILFRDNQWVGVGPTGNPISIPASAVTVWEPARIVPESEIYVNVMREEN